MRAIICRGYGRPDDVLQLADIDEPEVADGEVLVGVHAASVNSADWHLVRGVPRIARLQVGLRRPSFGVPGCDLAGRVEAVGKGVTSLRVGDEVFASSFMHGFGSFAERLSIPESLVAPKPSNLTFEEAAAVPLAGSTALQGLRDHGRIEAGHRVLIVGASGGVGTFAVQIAKALGAEVTGVCSTRNTDMVRSLGADHVVDYTKEDFTDGDRRYDLILQAAGTHSATACRRALTTTGTLVQISGTSNNRWIGPLDRIIAGRVLAPFVTQTITTFTVRPNRQDLEFLGALIEAGTVSPAVDRIYPLAGIHDAIRHVEGGHARGQGRRHRGCQDRKHRIKGAHVLMTLVRNVPGAAPPATPAVAARARAATKTYGKGDGTVVALDQVTVEFAAGAFTAIMGPSGSGKSTLMHGLAGLDELTSGQVFIGDVDLTTLDDKHLTVLRRDRVGFIFQAYNLVPTLTALENITLPMDLAGRPWRSGHAGTEPDRAWLHQVVDTIGLRDRLDHRPSELSGGQQQRVAVGRALAGRPEIIFADEPTGNLDSRSGTEILDFMRRAVRDLGQTIVMVTHDPSAASYADRVVFLADGRIVDEIQQPSAEAVLDRMKTFGR